MTVNMLRAVIVAQYEELLGSSRTVEDYRLLNNLRRMAADFLCSATEDAKFFNRTFEKILARSAADAPAGFNGIHAATLFDSLEKIVTNVLACGWRKEFGRIQLYTAFHKRLSSQLVGFEEIFKIAGYRLCTDQSWRLDGAVDRSVLLECAVDCFLASVECQLLQTVFERISHTKYSWSQLVSYRLTNRRSIESTVAELRKEDFVVPLVERSFNGDTEIAERSSLLPTYSLNGLDKPLRDTASSHQPSTGAVGCGNVLNVKINPCLPYRDSTIPDQNVFDESAPDSFASALSSSAELVGESASTGESDLQRSSSTFTSIPVPDRYNSLATGVTLPVKPSPDLVQPISSQPSYSLRESVLYSNAAMGTGARLRCSADENPKPQQSLAQSPSLPSAYRFYEGAAARDLSRVGIDNTPASNGQDFLWTCPHCSLANISKTLLCPRCLSFMDNV